MARLAELIRDDRAPDIYLPAWMDRLAGLGIDSADPQVARQQRLTNLFMYFSVFNAIVSVTVVSLFEFRAFALAHLPIVAMIVVALFIPRMHASHENLGAHAVAAFDIVGTLWLSFAYGRESEIFLYLSLSAILLLMFGIENWRRYVPWLALATVSLVVAFVFAPDGGLFAPHAETLRRVLAAQVVINTALVMSLVVFYAVANLRRAEVQLESQNRRSRLLLHAVFPPSIAARLASGQEQRIADRIDGLTVLFADLAGFTQASRNLPPETVIDYLDDMVRIFDRLCEARGLEKIKTIGDCYMAVGGLYGDAGRQAEQMGRLALDMIEAQARRAPLGDARLDLRVGIHSGDAMAGVIGDTRFSYDVWGDAVNTASRMESHGLPGRVHVSEAFRSRIGDAADLAFEERGAIDIKSIGETRTYLLSRAA